VKICLVQGIQLFEAIRSIGIKLMSSVSPEFNAAWFSKERKENLPHSTISFLHTANMTTSFTLYYHTILLGWTWLVEICKGNCRNFMYVNTKCYRHNKSTETVSLCTWICPYFKSKKHLYLDVSKYLAPILPEHTQWGKTG
jgi:hypothetical protein